MDRNFGSISAFVLAKRVTGDSGVAPISKFHLVLKRWFQGQARSCLSMNTTDYNSDKQCVRAIPIVNYSTKTRTLHIISK